MKESCGIYARDVLFRLKYDSLPVRPREIAKKLGIDIREQVSEAGFDGYLIKAGNAKGIMINSAIKYEQRKNFTIAHEIGHAEIPHHNEGQYSCLRSDIDFSAGQKLQEREANEFAAELLMPSSAIQEISEENPIGFNLVRVIADKCETSLISSAFRYIRFCPEMAALVVSENCKIKYFYLSESMKEARKFSLQPGSKLSQYSLANDYFIQDSDAEQEQNDQVALEAWFPGLDHGRYDCSENSIFQPAFKQVLSWVWISDKYDD